MEVDLLHPSAFFLIVTLVEEVLVVCLLVVTVFSEAQGAAISFNVGVAY